MLRHLTTLQFLGRLLFLTSFTAVAQRNNGTNSTGEEEEVVIPVNAATNGFTLEYPKSIHLKAGC
jgi:hypothetical protein